MESAVYDVLKEKLGDTKIKIDEEEKSVLELVSYWEEGVSKTKAANKDLTTQREAWEQERKTFKESVQALTDAKSELTEKLEAFQKKNKGSTDEKEEFQKQINALTEQIETLQGNYKEAQERAKGLEEKAILANKKASEEGLRNDLITNLTKHKIEGDKAADAIAIINSQGFAKLIQNSESGLYERSFCTTKDGKQLSASMDQLCKWIAETRPYLVSSSGKTGTGHTHDSHGPAHARSSYYNMISNRR